MYMQTALVSAALAATAHAGIAGLVMEGMTRGNPSVQQRRGEISTAVARHILATRQSSNVTVGQGAAATGGVIDMAAWDANVTAKCSQVLSGLPQASNPSGTCICYNIPVLDIVTGTFEADLRLYQISEPTGDFAGIPQKSIQVGLAYQGATVSPITNQTAAQIVTSAARLQAANAAAAKPFLKPREGNLKLLQAYLFAGKIDAGQIQAAATNQPLLEALVMPTVTLSAADSTGKAVSANVSTNEAAFVVGVFSDAVFMSNFAQANLAVQEQVDKLARGEVAFILPGTNILIQPIGLIIASIWLAIGLGFYGYGTYERIMYAESFKRRTAFAGKSSMGTI